jgi:hypothetical protein
MLGLALLWPAFVNGQPFFMADTSTYVRSADAAVVELTGIRTHWSDELSRRFPQIGDANAEPRSQHTAEPPLVLFGRSIYYGAILYVADVAGSLWLVVALQALLAAVCIILTLRRLVPHEGSAKLVAPLVVALLTLISPAAFFASYLMPDIFSGLAILAIGHLLFFSRDLGSREFGFWIAVLVLAVLFHTSNTLIAVALTILASLARIAGLFAFPWHRLLPIAIALLLGLAGEGLFGLAVEQATGKPPVRPPFIMARLIADGPGRDYLRESCPKSGFLLCRIQDLPADSDYFLWSSTRPSGVFSAIPYSQRRQLAAEQTRFVIGVVLTRPIPVLRSTFAAVLLQAQQVELGEFNYHPTQSQAFERKLPPTIMQEIRRSEAYHQTMPVKLVETLTLLSSIASIFLLCWTLLKVRGRGSLDPATGFALIGLMGIAANVVVCGALSTPHDRYLMRVLWVAPILAVAILQRIVPKDVPLARRTMRRETRRRRAGSGSHDFRP